MVILQLLGYLASVVMGLALGLTGGGGSILTVPILVYLFGIEALPATAYSLSLVGLVSLWGAWGAYKNGDLHLQRALAFGVPGVAGVLVARRLLLPLLPEVITIAGVTLAKNSILLVAFALLMLMASTSMILASREKKSSKTSKDANQSVSNLALLMVGVAVGVLAGFVGAGGGFLIVPALVNIGKLDMRQAVGTSLFVIALQSLLGVLGDLNTLRQMDFVLFVSVALLALVGMTVGTRLRKHIPQAKLKLGFGVFVLVIGSMILFRELYR